MVQLLQDISSLAILIKIKLKQMIAKLMFLKSTRFWAIVAIAIIGVLFKESIISSELNSFLLTILSGYTVVRTVDKFRK